MYMYAPNVPPIGLEAGDMYHSLRTSDIWFHVISVQYLINSSGTFFFAAGSYVRNSYISKMRSIL